MKILFVLPRMGGGGAERVVSLLSNSLSDANDVTVFTMVGGESFYPLCEGVKYESIGVSVNRKNPLTAFISKAFFFPKALIAINRKIKKGNYDVVISMLKEADILVGACKLFGARFKHVCSERNDPTKRGTLKLAILNAVYKRADMFVCQGQMVCDFYKKVPNDIKVVIPNPVNGEKLPERVIAPTKRVVAVGRLDKQKNFVMLINSFLTVHAKFPEYKLDIYGEGPEREHLQGLIDEGGAESYITLCGAKKNVQELIADAELFVMSSDYEGFPNALLEAMAIGLPVISTDFPTGIAHELISAENGITVPVNDEGAMTDAIVRLLADENARLEMGEANKKKCESYYIPSIIEKWKRSIANIVNK